MPKEKPPKFYLLKSIEPEETEDGLHSPNLEKNLEKYRRFENTVWEEFLEAEPGSTGEQSKAKKLARMYFLEAAHKQQTSQDKELWTRRFNEMITEIYGEPEISEASTLAKQELSLLSEDSDIRGAYEVIAQAGEDLPDHDVQEEFTEDEFELMRKSLHSHYSVLLDELESFRRDGGYSPEEVRDIFKKLLGALENESDEWSKWKAVNSNRSSIWVDAKQREIHVPDKRGAVNSFSELERLVVHEIGVHAARAASGHEKDSDKLYSGMFGYINAEEGLGIFFEYLASGIVPEKARDRYVDASIAYGLIPDLQMSREELIEFATRREIMREESGGNEVNEEKLELIKEKAAKHVNRLFRGGDGKIYETPEGPSQAVFIKDIIYYIGSAEMESFIKQKLEAGHEPGRILEYLLQGKFDPTNKRHVEYLKNRDDCFVLDDEEPKK